MFDITRMETGNKANCFVLDMNSTHDSAININQHLPFILHNNNPKSLIPKEIGVGSTLYMERSKTKCITSEIYIFLTMPDGINCYQKGCSKIHVL